MSSSVASVIANACEKKAPSSAQALARKRALPPEPKSPPPLPPPAEAPEEDAVSVSSEPNPKAKPASKNILVFKHHVRLSVGGMKKNFELKFWGNVENAIRAAEHFEPEAEDVITKFDSAARRKDVRKSVFEQVGCVFPDKKNIADQRQVLIQHLLEGGYMELEIDVLQHVWKLAMPGTKAVVCFGEDGFKVTMEQNGQKVERALQNLQKAAEWVTGYSTAIDKAIHNAAKQGKVALEQKAKLDAIAASSTPLEQLADPSKAPAVAFEKSKDVTQQFLDPDTKTKKQKASQGALPASSYSLYAGAIKKLSFRDNAMQKYTYGICGGSDSTISDVLLGSSIPEALESPERCHRWGNMEYTLLGLAVWDSASPENHKDEILQMFAQGSKSLALLMFNAKPEPTCFECHQGDDGAIVFEERALKIISHRGKGQKYCVVPLEKLGVTFDDEAQFLVGRALQSQLQSNFKDKAPANKNRLKVRKLEIPPDGWCFYHCVMAWAMFGKFLAIPRKHGFAVHRRQQRLESQLAEELRKQVVSGLASMAKRDDAAAAMKSLQASPYVEPSAIPLIAEVLGINVRCTMTQEACLGCRVLHKPGVSL